jgi:predicted transcriptional regulator
MVVDHVEDHLDPGAVQRLDEIAEFVDRTQRVLPRTITAML